MKSKIVVGILAMVFLLVACSEGEGCKTLSWGDAAYNNDQNIVEFKASAGSECGNYNDFYDADIDEIISKIKGMKFVILSKKCPYENPETGEIEEGECPDFIPETIKFGEIAGCSFGIADENSFCAASPLLISFKNESAFSVINWEFLVNDPLFYREEYPHDLFYSDIYGKRMTGKFDDDSLTVVRIEFTYNGDEKINKTYTVENN